jgi:hypothetical protein
MGAKSCKDSLRLESSWGDPGQLGSSTAVWNFKANFGHENIWGYQFDADM